MPPSGALALSAGPANAGDLLRLATAYQASRALHVAMELGLPDLLAHGPRGPEDLAAATAAHMPSLRRLLRALAAQGVFAEDADGRFTLAQAGRCLLDGEPGSVRDLILMFGHEDFWRTWGQLAHCVRTGETAAELLFGPGNTFVRYAAEPTLGRAFDAGMTVLSATVAAAVVANYDVSGRSRIVDVGGGQGRLIASILRANPDTRGVLFDLPQVVAGAGRLLAEAGVADRCEIIAGNMFEAVPSGDLHLLSRVIHDWDDARAVAILANCRRAMGDRPAKLVLVERVLPDRIEPTPAIQAKTLSDLNMLVRTGGRERTETEYRALLGAAGLRLTRMLETGAPMSLVEAEAG